MDRKNVFIKIDLIKIYVMMWVLVIVTAAFYRYFRNRETIELLNYILLAQGQAEAVKSQPFVLVTVVPVAQAFHFFLFLFL